jgi:arylsulfatase A-like enzyme
MTRERSAFQSGESFTAPLAIPMVMTGVALPIGFAGYLDALVQYHTTAELFSVYAWAWLVFVVAGLAAALAVSIPAKVFDWLVRLPKFTALTIVNRWAASVIAAAALIKGLKVWLQNAGLVDIGVVVNASPAFLVAMAVGCALWNWRRPDHFAALRSIAQIGTATGLIVAVPVALIALFGSSEDSALATAKQARKAPNIVLVTVDSLAADHMSLYGYQRPTTPRLDRIAQQATVFERFYANSNFTTPSVHAIMHGLRPWSSRVLQLKSQIDAKLATQNLAARVRASGYQTFAVATNRVASPSHVRIARWIDTVAQRQGPWLLRALYLTPRWAWATWDLGILPDILLALRVDAGPSSEPPRYNARLALAKAEEMVARREPGRPFFLWVHVFEPHYPYAAPPPFVGQFDAGSEKRTAGDSMPPRYFMARRDPSFPALYAARYDEAILYVDQQIGDFVEWLDTEGVLADTLLVITADHGESFIKGYGQHAGPMLFNSLIHVPLIVKEPLQRTGRRVPALGEQIDLMPTLLDLVGLPFEGAGEGHSIRSALTGSGGADAVFSMNLEQSSRFGPLSTGTVSMIEDRWKFDHYFGQHKYTMLPELKDALYDIESDPFEATDLTASHPVVAARMLSKIEAELEQHDKPRQ